MSQAFFQIGPISISQIETTFTDNTTLQVSQVISSIARSCLGDGRHVNVTLPEYSDQMIRVSEVLQYNLEKLPTGDTTSKLRIGDTCLFAEVSESGEVRFYSLSVEGYGSGRSPAPPSHFQGRLGCNC